MRRLLLLLLTLALLPQALAVVDLIAPTHNITTNTTSFTFEYYASIPNLASCTLNIGNQTFPDFDVESNAMNSVQVQNIPAGSYLWNVSCSGSENETSLSRRLAIDTQAPTLVIVSPLNGSILTSIPLDIIPNDNLASQLNCTMRWNGALLEQKMIAANTHYSATYAGTAGSGTLAVVCTDAAGNANRQERTLTLEPQLFFTLTTDKTEYGIGDPVQLTVNTLPNVSITIDVCPNQQGFVQCTSALIDASTFPQTITLPYLNKTGSYVVDGLVTYGNQTRANQTLYNVTNSIAIDLTSKKSVDLNETVDASASISGGIPPYAISWKLPNGTVRTNTSATQIHFPNSGSYNVTITASDAAGNTKTKIFTYEVKPVYAVKLFVTDNVTGAPIVGAGVEIAERKATTLSDGSAYLDVPEGRHDIFITATGYEYFLEEFKFNESRTLLIALQSKGEGPQVQITSPAQNAITNNPVRITYTVSHSQPVTCTLLLATDTNWFVANGSAQVSNSLEQLFTSTYPIGEHKIQIECQDSKGVSGSSQLTAFTVQQGASQSAQKEQGAAPTVGDLYLQQQVDALTTRIDALSAMEQREREAAETVGFDKQLRNLKRAIQQAIRDIDSLQFRTDLDEQSRQLEHERIITSIQQQVDATPVGLKVVQTRTYVQYVEEEDLDELFAQFAGVEGTPQDSRKVRKQLLEDQQLFTVSTTLRHIEYTYPSGQTKTHTLVVRSYTYAQELDPGYFVLEAIPKDVFDDAKKIEYYETPEILKQDPIIRFPTKERIAYEIPKRVDFTLMEQYAPLLARTYEDGGGITAMAIFSVDDLDGIGLPALLLVGLILLVWLAYYFDLFKQVKYIAYKLGRNEKVHYVRVLVNDAEDQLSTGNYEKAELLYKEVRMTYDTLSQLAQNDLYEDVMRLVHAMDAYYFNVTMLALNDHIKANDLESAIAAYEKLVGTFERLDPERQQQLIDSVTAIAHRLGVGA